MSSAPDQETIDGFVNAAHGNRPAVEAALAERPELVNARSSLGESPLAAAAHVGNAPLAEYLLGQGAEPELPAAAMLGRADEVRAAVDADPTQANAAGAHGIPILFHACIGGQEEIARYLVASGAATNPASLGQCLHAAIHARNVSIARWLIELGADTTTADWQGKTPRERAEETGDAAFVALLSAG